MAQVQQTVRLVWISAFGQLGDDVLYAIVLEVFHKQLVTYENAIDVTQKRLVHVYFFTSSTYMSFFFLGATISAAVIVLRRSGGGQSIALGKNFAALSDKSSISLLVLQRFKG
jgi:hypothetical protein